MTTTNDLPEFNVSVKMARKTGPLHADVEYRTFTLRTPAVNLYHAREAGFGLGHGVNDATNHEWKFAAGAHGIAVEPATDAPTEVEQLRAELEKAQEGRKLAIEMHDASSRAHLDTLRELEKVRAQLTDANRALAGHKADERSLTAANTALANELASARAAGDALYKATHAAFQHICFDLDENNPRVSDFFANALTTYRTTTEKAEA